LKMAKTMILTLVCALVVVVSALPLNIKSITINAKELAGPASEFKQNQLPLPEEVTQLQISAMIPLWLDSNSMATFAQLSQSVIWTGSLLCDSADGFEFSFLSPNASSVTLTLTDPTGKNVDLSNGIAGVYAIGGTNIPETSWIFDAPVVGAYTLTISSTSSNFTRSVAASEDIPFGYVITLSASSLTMVGHLSTYNTQQGQQVGLVASVVQEDRANPFLRSLTPAELRARAIKSVINSAVMTITLPNGQEEDIDMYDDGLHMDFEAEDGVYGGIVTANDVGAYEAQATLQGQHSDGTSFIRTTQHLISSVADDLNLAGSAVGVMSDSEHMVISLDVVVDTNVHPADQTYRGYAEVYGPNSNGELTAACWIGGMTQVVQNGNFSVVQLVLDVSWLKLAGVNVPVTLQNVVLQEVDSFIPISMWSSISVQMDQTNVQIIKSSLLSMPALNESTKAMKEGVMPSSMTQKTQGVVDGAIILLHGYCSATNPFAANPSDWTTGYYFLNPSASTTHDAFAQLVLAYAQTNNLNTYSIVGHSQGGVVGAHIKNYYFSGLDLVGTGKKLQSIGSPYEGCTAAGSSASLGKLFGVGCGTNFDLSLDGSRLWEPSITTDTRKEINYYTTTYKQGNLFGDSCSAAMNMILEWPNDGTAELTYTDIKGANNMGNTQKQCHTTGMNYVAQYLDHTRNKLMNTAAAR